MAFEKVKGSTDFYPEEMSVMTYLSGKFREMARKYSFQEVDSPAIETVELLTAKSGEEVKQQIFVLEKKGSEELGLRFDLTVPQTRMFIAKQKEINKPVKWFAVSRMWRYEQPQKGRLREFFQFNAELFGSKSAAADAELLSLIIDFLKSLGLTENDFFIKLNNRRLLEGMLSDFVAKAKIADVVRLIDKSKKISQKEFKDELSKLGVEDVDRVSNIISLKGFASDILPRIEAMTLNKEARAGFEQLQDVADLVDPSFLRIDLSVARGLAYYTGNVFEVFDIDEEFRAIAGGGRYDDMIKLFGGQDTPAAGFGMGYSVLSLLLDDKGLLPKSNLGPDYYVAIVNALVMPKALEIVKTLRKKYSVDYDLCSRNLTNQFQYASSIKAKKIIIVGPKDLESGKVTVRDMLTGDEKKVKVEELE